MSRLSKSDPEGVVMRREWKQYIAAFLRLSGWTRKKMAEHLGVSKQTVYAWLTSSVPGKDRMIEISLQLEVACPSMLDRRPGYASAFNPFYEYTYDQLITRAKAVPLTMSDVQQLLNRCAELLSRQIKMTGCAIEVFMESNLGGHGLVDLKIVPAYMPGSQFVINLSITKTTDVAYALHHIFNNMTNTPLSGHICDKSVLVLLRKLRHLIPREEAATKAGGLGFNESSFSEVAAKSRVLK